MIYTEWLQQQETSAREAAAQEGTRVTFSRIASPTMNFMSANITISRKFRKLQVNMTRDESAGARTSRHLAGFWRI